MPATIEQTATSIRPIKTTPNSCETVEFHSGLAGSNTSFLINSNSYTVPAGKRLVVQSVDASVVLDDAASIDCWLVVGESSDPSRSHALSFQPVADAASRKYEVALNALVCVEPCGSISFCLARTNAAGCWSAAFKARGYLMDAAHQG